VHLSLKILPVTTILMIFQKSMSSPRGGETTLGGGMAISGGGTPDTGCGMLFWLNFITATDADQLCRL